MGQKVNAVGLRVGINRNWESRWYADKNYAAQLHQDLKIRAYLHKRLQSAGVSKVIIERTGGRPRLNVHAARPGLIVGKKGEELEQIRTELMKKFDFDAAVQLVEIRKPEIDAVLVAESVAQQLERRVVFRRAMRRATQNAERQGALGIRINCAGRLGGAEIARTEWYREGRVPLHTLRSDVDYGTAEALTTYGLIGVKVWIYRGDIMEHDLAAQERHLHDAQILRGNK